MNLRNITLAFIGLTSLFFSCNGDTEYDLSGASKDAQISSFSLKGLHDKTLDSLERAQDSVRFVILGKTKFAIDQINNVVYNPDSLPYGFNLKTLLTTVAYNASPSSVSVLLAGALKEGVVDTTYKWNGTDSINLAYNSIRLEVVAADYQTMKQYKIDLRIHKIDPEVLSWNLAGSFPRAANERKALLASNLIYNLTETLSSDFILELVQEEGQNPLKASVIQKNISGLPSNTKVSTFSKFGELFYVLTEDGKTYTSENAEAWTERTNGVTVSSILGLAPGNTSNEDRVVVLLEKDSQTYFGTTTDFSSITQLSAIPADFPVKGFASFTNTEGLNSRKILFVATGKDRGNNDLSSVWLLQMNGTELSIAKTASSSLFSGEGNSLFLYDGKVRLFSKGKFYVSSSWGVSWVAGDEKQALPEVVKHYTEQSVIVKENNTVWLLNGKTEGGDKHIIDIWGGILNRLK